MINLAPNLEKPLSLTNPLDYVRLLYWVIYFPQAIVWYDRNFCNEITELEDYSDWGKRWQLFWNRKIDRNLFFQGLILVVTIPFIFNLLLKAINFDVYWKFTFIYDISIIILSFISLFFYVYIFTGGVKISITNFVLISLSAILPIYIFCYLFISIDCSFFEESCSWDFNYYKDINYSSVDRLINGSIAGIAIGYVLSYLLRSILLVKTKSRINNPFLQSTNIFIAFASISILTGIFSPDPIVNNISLGIFASIVIIHPIDYLVSLIRWQLSKNTDYKLLSRISIIPVPKIQDNLEKQLQEDWEVGIEYINQLRKYTLQFIPLVNAINNVLENTPSELVIDRIKILVEKTEDYSLIYYLSASLNKEIIFESIISIFPLYLIPKYQIEKIKDRFCIQTRTNTYSRVIAAVYYYTKNKQIEKAKEAFTLINHLNNSEQLQALITTN